MARRGFRRKGGWYGDSRRHSLAARGIRTGRMQHASMSRFNPNRYMNPAFHQRNLAMKVLKRGFVIGAIEFVPMAREIYVGYRTASLLYSSWKYIYAAYKNPDTMKQQAYDFARDELRTGLSSYQTGLIWNNIESKIPEPIRDEAHSQLTNIMSNVSEEEISLVEHALAAF